MEDCATLIGMRRTSHADIVRPATTARESSSDPAGGCADRSGRPGITWSVLSPPNSAWRRTLLSETLPC